MADENNREIAIKIISEFENLLAKYQIKLPCNDRENVENEAYIFGTDYYELEDNIIGILNNYIK